MQTLRDPKPAHLQWAQDQGALVDISLEKEEFTAILSEVLYLSCSVEDWCWKCCGQKEQH